MGKNCRIAGCAAPKQRDEFLMRGREIAGKGKSAGFSISIDALFATIVALAILTMIGLGVPQEARTVTPELNLRQATDDAFAALDNSGVILEVLVDRTYVIENPAEELREKAKKLLPEHMEVKVVVTEYEAVHKISEDPDVDPLEDCKASFMAGSPTLFTDCFTEKTTFNTDPAQFPENKEIMHGRKIEAMRTLGVDDETGSHCSLWEEFQLEFKGEETEELIAALKGEASLNTQMIVTDPFSDLPAEPLTELKCAENPNDPAQGEVALVTMKMRDSSRDPIAAMLVMDRSGSMATYDMLAVDDSGRFNQSTCKDEGGQEDETCRGNHTNCDYTKFKDWKEIEPYFEISQEIYDVMGNNSRFLIYSTGGDSEESICGRVPILKVKSPDNAEIGYGTNYISISKAFLGDNYPNRIGEGKFWKLSAWSDVQVTGKRFYAKIGGSANYKPAIQGQGTTSGNGTFERGGGATNECQNFGSWEEVGTFEITENQAIYDHQIVYIQAKLKFLEDYEGQCLPMVKIKNNGEETTPVKCTGRTCYSNYFSYGFYGPYADPGTYSIWVWSDDAMDYSAEYRTDRLLFDIATGVDISGGTCDGGTCVYVGSNCPGNDQSGYTGKQELGPFAITDAMLDGFSSGQISIRPSAMIEDICEMPYLSKKLPLSRIVYPTGEHLGSGQYADMRYSPYYYASLTGDVTKEILTTNIWMLETWSNVPVTADFYLHVVNRLPNDTYSVRGPDVGCADPAGWDEIKTTNVSEDLFILLFEFFPHDSYAGQCENVKIKVETPGHTVALDLGTGTDPNRLKIEEFAGLKYRLACSGSGWCHVIISRVDGDVGGGALLEKGDYKIYMWSDSPISGQIANIHKYKEFLLPELSNSTIQDGTCHYQECRAGLPTNCGNPGREGWVDDLSVFSVGKEDDITGLKLEIRATNYDGECKAYYGNPKAHAIPGIYWGPAFRVRDPNNDLFVEGLRGSDCYDASCGKTFSWTLEKDRLYELEGWADEDTSYTAKWYITRLDSAKMAAKEFIDNPGWQADDRFGLVTYSDDVDSVMGLTQDKQEFKQALNGMTAGDGTAIVFAISKAISELESPGTASKYIILLTDGRANICADGEECPSAACSCEDAANDAISVAKLARDNGIVVYAIGFADQSLIGSYKDTLQRIAKDSDTTYCTNPDPATEEAQYEYCGKYYYAADKEELAEIYSLVAGEIKKRFGDVDIEVPFPEGMEIVYDNVGKPGVFGGWDDRITDNGHDFGNWIEEPTEIVDVQDEGWDPETNTLRLEEQVISYFGSRWFAMQFKVMLPCSGVYCELDYVLFPPTRGGTEQTKISDTTSLLGAMWDEKYPGEYCTKEELETYPVCENKYSKIPFEYKDLKFGFTGGSFSNGDVLLDFNVANRGFKDVPLTGGRHLLIDFYYADGDKAGNGMLDCTSGPCVLKGGIGNPSPTLSGTVVPATPPETGLQIDGLTICRSKTHDPDDPMCTRNEYTDVEVNVEDMLLNAPPAGDITAVMNESGNINECSLNNSNVIYCGLPKFMYYTIDYYVWLK